MEKIIIDSGEKLQKMEGFGISGAWWAQHIGGYDNNCLRKITDLLFDKEDGIGISIYRYNIGAGSGINISDCWRKTESFEVNKGEYDWGRDKNAIQVLKAAKNKGVEKFIAFANSPPARMTESGFVTGGKKGLSNLRKDMYEDFAQYLIDIAKHLIDEEKIPLGYISPVNEPQWKWNISKGQEGCHYSGDECCHLIKILIKKIKETNANIKISIIESGQWKDADIYIDKVFKDKDIREELDHFTIHSYWSDKKIKKEIAHYVEKYYPEIKIWMSEWTEMKEGRDYGMDSALVLANTIHDDITIGGVTSWQYWIAVSKYDYRDGLLYINSTTHEIEETKRLWALGNYSKYIRPGYIRIKAQIKNKYLKASAYIDETKEKIIAVIVNNSNNFINAEFLFEINEKFRKARIFETSKTNNLKNIYSDSLISRYNFNPKSITTFVWEINEA